jgi:hypothetical protein
MSFPVKEVVKLKRSCNYGASGNFFFFLIHSFSLFPVSVLKRQTSDRKIVSSVPVQVGIEESIVNVLVSLHSKNTNNANSEVRFKQLIRDPPTFT